MQLHNILSAFATHRSDQNAVFNFRQLPDRRRRFWRRILAETALRTYDRNSFHQRMIFCTENAGKWVASKSGKVIATDRNLEPLMRKIEARTDKDAICFDLVAKTSVFIGGHGHPWYDRGV